ncbi:peptidylprolyl isomerase fpr3, partial [Coemansia biformis]
AALSASLANESRTSVVLTIDDKSFVLCSLTPGRTEQQSLDISLTEGEQITFETQGGNEVHLTGNFIDDSLESSDDGDDESDDEGPDLSNVSPEELQELIDMGVVDPEMLLGGDDDSDDQDYDSDDAEADGRIREITDEEEAELAREAAEAEEQPVKEVKIKKQAEKAKKTEQAKKADKTEQTDKKRKALEAAKAVEEQDAKKAKKVAEDKKAAEAKKSTPVKELAGGVKAEIMKEGEGPGAKKGARVGMYYIGKLTNGKVFDKNTKGKPFWFRLGAGEVIKGWDVGIIGMKKGGERRLTIPAAMAYGKRGAPPDIPANATL